MEIKDDDASSFSPSFSTYSGDRLAEIADRVSRRITEEEEDDDFEFEILQTTPSSSNSLVFPVFDKNLISVDNKPEALEDLFLRDPPPVQQQSYSSSSEDEDEIQGEIYCPWTPARSTAEMSPSGGCRKSKSTGSSSTKRWRIRDLLLKRSHSDGKQSLKFMDSSGKNKDKEKVSPHEKFYLRNKAIKEEDKRKSYLPYKQQLVGLFANIHRYAKTSHP